MPGDNIIECSFQLFFSLMQKATIRALLTAVQSALTLDEKIVRVFFFRIHRRVTSFVRPDFINTHLSPLVSRSSFAFTRELFGQQNKNRPRSEVTRIKGNLSL